MSNGSGSTYGMPFAIVLRRTVREAGEMKSNRIDGWSHSSTKVEGSCKKS
jgi:hypothetical protein